MKRIKPIGLGVLVLNLVLITSSLEAGQSIGDLLVAATKGLNAPLSITSSTATQINNTGANFTIYGHSDVSCGPPSGKQTNASNGSFPISTGTHTYYVSTTNTNNCSASLCNNVGVCSPACMLCPSGTTSGSIDLEAIGSNAGACTVNTRGCITATCSATGTLTAITVTTTPQVTCP